MEQKGEYTSASGNVFMWERDTAPGRHAIRGKFSKAPTREDFTEISRHVMTLVPATAKLVDAGMATPQRTAAVIDSFLGRPGRN